MRWVARAAPSPPFNSERARLHAPRSCRQPARTCSNRLVRSAASGWPSKFMKRRAGTQGGTRASTAVRLKAGPPAQEARRVRAGAWEGERAGRGFLSLLS